MDCLDPPPIPAGNRTPDFGGQTLDVVVREAQVAHVHEVLDHLGVGVWNLGIRVWFRVQGSGSSRVQGEGCGRRPAVWRLGFEGESSEVRVRANWHRIRVWSWRSCMTP